MKKKLFVMLMAIPAALCCVFGLSACGDDVVIDGGNGGGNGGGSGNGQDTPVHKHSYSSEVIPSTCTESGYTLHTCECDDSYRDNETAPLGHDLQQFKAKEATCTEGGWDAYEACKRSNCNYTTRGADLPALGHKPVEDKGTPETCTADGLTDGAHCERCKQILTQQEIIPSTGHKFIYEKLTDGHSVACSRCDENFANEQHDWKDNACTKCKYEENPEWSKGLYYRLSTDETYYILAGIGSCTDKVLIIPERYNGLPVKEIAYGALSNSDITKVVISDSVERLSNRTFENCAELTSVTLGKGVKYIGGNDFAHTPKLTEINFNAVACEYAGGTFMDSGMEADGITVNIGAEVTSIPNHLFTGTVNYGDSDHPQGILYYAKIKNVVFSTDSVCTEIGNSSFSNNVYLESITLPESLKTIGGYVFQGCTALTSINVPKNVEAIGYFAFSGTTALTSIEWNAASCQTLTNIFGNCGKESEGVVLYVGESVIKLPERMFSKYADDISNITEIRFAQNCALKEIGAYAFSEVTALRKIALPEGVQTIGEFAFNRCSGITSITVPESVQTIGQFVFSGCPLTQLTIPFIGESRTVNKNSKLSFIGATGAQKVTVTDTSVLPDECFANCNIKTVNVLKAVASVGEEAFSGCTSLETVIFTQVEKIGDYAFNGCTSLTNISFNGLMEIGEQAFVGCTSLLSVTLPDTLIKIGVMAFAENAGLQKLVIGKKVAEIGVGAFYNCSELIEVYYNAERGEVTNTSYNDPNVFGHSGNSWDIDENERKTISLTIGTDVRIIPEKLFYRSNVKKIIFEPQSNCERIGAYAFYECDFLTSVVLPDSFKIIEEGAFTACFALNYNYYNSGKYLGSELNPYLMLCDVEIPNDSTSYEIHEDTVVIGNGVFANFTKLTSVNMPQKLTCVGNLAFFGSKLTNFTIPDGVLYIGNEAFVGALTETLRIPDSVLHIGNKSLGIDNLKSLYIGKNVTYIGESICWYCKDLCKIEVAEENAYYHSKGNCLIETKTKRLIQGCLSSEIPSDGTVEILSSGSFLGSGLEQITIPDGVKIIEDYAFMSNENLVSIDFSDGVISIGSQAFDYCEKLKNIYLPDSLTNIGRYIFEVDNGELNIELNEFSNAMYLGSKTNPYLLLVKAVNNEITECTIHENTRLIYEDAFKNCSNLICLNIPENIVFIGNDAFMNCINVTEINYNATKLLTTISNNTRVFGNVGMNTDGVVLTIGANVKEIPDYIFWEGNFSPYAKPNITSIIFEDGSVCERIGKYAFFGVDSITSITLPDSVITIGENAFCACRNLSSVHLGRNVTVLEEYVFAWTALTEFPTGGNIQIIRSMAFVSCPISGCIELPETLEILETSMLDGNSEIESIIIYSNVKVIEEAAINGCSKLEKIYFYGTKENWEDIDIAERNYNLNNTIIYYYSETQPTDGGNFWHYVDGEAVVW